MSGTGESPASGELASASLFGAPAVHAARELKVPAVSYTHLGKRLGTIFSLIMDLEREEMYFAPGNPCNTEYHLIKF